MTSSTLDVSFGERWAYGFAAVGTPLYFFITWLEKNVSIPKEIAGVIILVVMALFFLAITYKVLHFWLCEETPTKTNE